MKNVSIDSKNIIVFASERRSSQLEQLCPPDTFGQYVERYDLHSIESCVVNGKTFSSDENTEIIAYKIGDNCYKLSAFSKSDKTSFSWIGGNNKPENYKNIWGIDQLPVTCETILITEGLKDAFVANANLNHLGIYAVGADNVSTNLPEEVIGLLKCKCKDLVLCYDIDKRGIEGAIKQSIKHNLKVCTLPELLVESGGKDISDWFKAKLDIRLLLESINKAGLLANILPDADPELHQTLEMEALLLERADSPIKPEPLVMMEEYPIIVKGTINAIIGREGSHKSRLAESFASLLLSSQTECDTEFGFRRHDNSGYHIIYVDTERNSQYEYPLAIRNILTRIEETNDSEFHPISLKTISRMKRQGVLKKYIDYYRRSSSGKHMVVFLDVLTDCMANFNDVVETLELFDYLGNITESSDSTFITVIHQNPSGEFRKGRGHAGSELANKANTVIYISHKDEIISLDFAKTRNSKSVAKMYLKYNEFTCGLTKLTSQEESKIGRIKEQAIQDLKKYLLEIMPDQEAPYEQKHIIGELKQRLGLSNNTIKSRIQTLSSQNDKFDDKTVIQITQALGKPTTYKRILPLVGDLLNLENTPDGAK